LQIFGKQKERRRNGNSEKKKKHQENGNPFEHSAFDNRLVAAFLGPLRNLEGIDLRRIFSGAQKNMTRRAAASKSFYDVLTRGLRVRNSDFISDVKYVVMRFIVASRIKTWNTWIRYTLPRSLKLQSKDELGIYSVICSENPHS
jgi:hypothetical protein